MEQATNLVAVYISNRRQNEPRITRPQLERWWNLDSHQIKTYGIVRKELIAKRSVRVILLSYCAQPKKKLWSEYNVISKKKAQEKNRYAVGTSRSDLCSQGKHILIAMQHLWKFLRTPREPVSLRVPLYTAVMKISNWRKRASLEEHSNVPKTGNLNFHRFREPRHHWWLDVCYRLILLGSINAFLMISLWKCSCSDVLRSAPELMVQKLVLRDAHEDKLSAEILMVCLWLWTFPSL